MAQGSVGIGASGACVHETALKRRSTLYCREGIWGCREGGPDIYGAFTTSWAPGSTCFALLSLYDDSLVEMAYPFLSYCGDFPASHGQVRLPLSFLTFALRTWAFLLSRLLGKERPWSISCNLVNHLVKNGPDRMALTNLTRAILHKVKLGKLRCHTSLAVSTGSDCSCKSVPARGQMSFDQAGSEFIYYCLDYDINLLLRK